MARKVLNLGVTVLLVASIVWMLYEFLRFGQSPCGWGKTRQRMDRPDEIIFLCEDGRMVFRKP